MGVWGGGRVDGDNGWVCGVGAGWMEIKDGCVGWGQGGWR